MSSIVPLVYAWVIDDVVTNMENQFASMGIDKQLLRDFNKVVLMLVSLRSCFCVEFNMTDLGLLALHNTLHSIRILSFLFLKDTAQQELYVNIPILTLDMGIEDALI
ncbi:hypothetical protein BC829DRAFT_381179 [Chytridium lagenaria]|nr:hypothetical protein BC829DRAFT_381179 [Chytridium lagenaria]